MKSMLSELLPKRGTTFDVKDQSGLSIAFEQDANGKVVEAAFNDNGTVRVMKKIDSKTSSPNGYWLWWSIDWPPNS